ncbi:Retrovirus-related Pol polyprotein from transposon TNT 1-94 [Quillaja saponaria]|uniref:Retrovirus-related Pol polyprotein from transposon TNT 1-94 n=1 Tax=Quillaja saponaria TaxID=32244 RepID=A0AAD7LG15_QUISA|nr:Retrovirus-related Pol polyprotein from transposon TNT 1-94 [Quillaja saponaria]
MLILCHSSTSTCAGNGTTASHGLVNPSACSRAPTSASYSRILTLPTDIFWRYLPSEIDNYQLGFINKHQLLSASRVLQIQNTNSKWWDHNRDRRKRHSNKASTAATTETKMKADVAAGEPSALVVAGGNGGKVLNSYVPISNSTWIIDSAATDHMTINSRQKVGFSKPISQDVDENREVEGNMDSSEPVDLEGDATQAIDVTQAAKVPNQSSSEDVLEPSRKQIPSRHNRGIPKPKYEPEISSKVKYPMSHYMSNNRLSGSNQSFVNQLSTVSIPNSVQEALGDSRWKVAMNEEMKSLIKNNTWELVDCPPGKKTVGCRWVYTVKFKVDGTIEQFKARLVAKGYTQTYGIDYTETFAPVAKINIIRVLLSLSSKLGLDIATI